MIDIELLEVVALVFSFLPEELPVNPLVELHQRFPHFPQFLPQDCVLFASQ